MANKRGQGRKPLPTNWKLLTGEPNKDRINTDEPEFSCEGIKRPNFLDYHAKWFWDEYSPQLINTKVMRVTDVPMFSMLCMEWSLYRRCTAKLKKMGEHLIKTNKDGDKQIYVNPVRYTQRSAIENFNRIAAHFGLSPAERSRIKAKADSCEDDFEFS